MNSTISALPYELEAGLKPGSDLLFQWSIRKQGKLLQRSDRSYTTLNEAVKKGEAALDQLREGR